MSACWRHSRDRAFEAVKRVRPAPYDDVEALIVLVATGFAGRHRKTPRSGIH
jgi:hypothetical protein